jgi:glycosylphosphatidylinositol transamidase (GPIT) subunit GPI8
MNSIVKTLREIMDRSEGSESRHDDLMAELAHELLHLLGHRKTKAEAAKHLDACFANVKTALLEDLDNAYYEFREEVII